MCGTATLTIHGQEPIDPVLGMTVSEAFGRVLAWRATPAGRLATAMRYAEEGEAAPFGYEREYAEACRILEARERGEDNDDE